MNFPSSVNNARHNHSGQKALEYPAQLQQQDLIPLKAPELSHSGSLATRSGLFLAVLLLLPLSHGHNLLFELPEARGSQALRIGKPGKPEISFLNILAWMSAVHSGPISLWVHWPLASYFGYRDSDPFNLSLPEAVGDLYPLLDESKPLLVWEGHSQKITFDFSQPPIPEDFFWLDRYIHQPWRIYKTKDRQGQIIYYWYDQQGNRHVISQQEYWLMLAQLSESWLHRLYPEIFGSPLPPGGGWHVWVYTQRKPPQGRQASGRGKGGRDLGARGRGTGARGGGTDANRRGTSASARGTDASVEAADSIASLITEFQTGVLQQAVKRFGEIYNGKNHRHFCIRIKNVTQQRRQPLSLQEKQQLKPFITHLSDIVEFSSFDARSISTCIHSLTSSGLLHPLKQDGELTQAIQALTEALFNQVTQESYFDKQGLANLLWALAKLVENGLDSGQANGAVTKLLLQVVQVAQRGSCQAGFKPQEIASLLWALAKLVENGLGHGQANEVVAALLPQVVQVSHQAGFTSQGVANLLWALAKLVESGLDHGQANGAVMALLLQVMQVAQVAQAWSCQAGFKPQEITNLLWALAKLVESGLDHRQANGAVMALLLQVVQVAQGGSRQAGFNPQEIANLLWALAKLVENGLDHGQANWAVTALLPLMVQVAQGESHQAGFKPQEIANLLWALAKLVENGLDHGPANWAVTVLLPQVVQVAQQGGSHQAGFKPQGVTNLLWALAKLVESGLDPGQANEAVTTLLPQVVQVAQGESHQTGFKPQGVANLLWALAKLVEYGLDHGQASGAVMELLPQVVQVAQGESHQAGFTSQGIANLLWALAKLVEYGFDHGQANGAVTALLSQVVQVAQGGSHQAGLTSQGVTSLLWALALLGESIELKTINEILAALSFSEQYSLLDQAQLLWSFMVFMARGVSISDQLKLSMGVWYQALNQQAAANELATILAMAAVWLDLEGNFNPIYKTNISNLQRKIKEMLADKYSNIEIKTEYSFSQLSPVDFYLPEHRVAIEIQGPHHFTDKELLSKTGKTILKVKTYKKLGIHVIEVPYRDIESDKLEWFWDQLLQLLMSEAQQTQASVPE